MAPPEKNGGDDGPDSTLFSKLIPVFCLIVTTAASCTLVGLKATGWEGKEPFVDFVSDNPTTRAISVQVVSQLLGLLQISALCKIQSPQINCHQDFANAEQAP